MGSQMMDFQSLIHLYKNNVINAFFTTSFDDDWKQSSWDNTIDWSYMYDPTKPLFWRELEKLNQISA